MRRLVPILLGALTIVGLWSSAASAQDGADRRTPRTRSSSPGSWWSPRARSETALIFDGPATVAGEVQETLVVFNGDAEITGTVREDVVVFNGDLVIRSGAEVGGDLVTNSTPTVEEGATVRGDRVNVVTRFDVDVVGFAGRFAWWVGYTVSSLILGLLLLAFAPRLEGKVRAAVKDRLGPSIGWGAGLFFLLPIGSVLLLVTVVGIPLGLFTMLALAPDLLGRLRGRGDRRRRAARQEPPSSRFLVFLVGWLPCARSR